MMGRFPQIGRECLEEDWDAADDEALAWALADPAEALLFLRSLPRRSFKPIPVELAASLGALLGENLRPLHLDALEAVLGADPWWTQRLAEYAREGGHSIQ